MGKYCQGGILMGEKKSFWQLWKDTLAILATAAIAVYVLGAILHTFDAATMSRLVQTYQVMGAVVFCASWVLTTFGRWLYLRYTHSRAKVSK